MNPFRQRIPTRWSAERNGQPERQAVGPATTSTPAARSGLVPPRPGPKRLLWEVLVELGFVDEQSVLEAESVARAERQDLGAVLLERGLVSTDQLARAVADREGLAFVDLDAFEVDERAASMITPAVAERYGAALIGFGDNGHVLLAVSNPRDHHAINDIAMMIEPSVTRVVATSEDLEALIRRRQEAVYGDQGDEGAEEDVAAAEASEPAEAFPPAEAFAPAAEEEEKDEEEDMTSESESVTEGVPDLVVVPGVAAQLPESPSPVESRRPDAELLESLAQGLTELERLVRETAGDRDRDAALAEVERKVEELRAQLAGERKERAESERALRGELETERATREALATDLVAVRTARDDLVRRVASARDLLDLGAGPHVHLSGRDH